MEDTPWDIMLDYWPVTIFLPVIAIILITLAVITRIWDNRDHNRQ